MTVGWRTVQRTYLLLTLLTTLAASLIWGINTLFLLDAGLSNAEAFSANALFTTGLVLFEIPTGVVADTRGRRASFLLGVATLLLSTLLYLWMWWIEGPFVGWAVASLVIGVGFSFLSGAVEAWLVDGLAAGGFRGDLDAVFARGQMVSGAAMLTGSVAGGALAQATSLGVPFLVRAGLLAVTLVVAGVLMHDDGFTPRRDGHPAAEVRRLLHDSLTSGLGDRRVRWLMLEAPFTAGVGVYAFYAMQPYLLELYGDPSAFGIAGLAAAVTAGAQIVGGLTVPLIRRVARRRTRVLAGAVSLGALALVGMGVVTSFVPALALLVVWGLTFAASRPVRQAYLNAVIASDRRATVLSFDSLMGSVGGVVAQPALGRLADASGYAASYVASGAVTAVALPFLLLAGREGAAADRLRPGGRVAPCDQPVPPDRSRVAGGGTLGASPPGSADG